MEERKKAAYEYLSKCLFSASEYLREAADTIDIESLEGADYETIDAMSKKLERRAQLCQGLAKERRANNA